MEKKHTIKFLNAKKRGVYSLLVEMYADVITSMAITMALEIIREESHRERLTKIVNSFFHATDKHTRANFCGYMKFYEINAMSRDGKDGRVYGLTLVDNRKCTVFNGSDLGKGYSGQALMKRFDIAKNLERPGERKDRLSLPTVSISEPSISESFFAALGAGHCERVFKCGKGREVLSIAIKSDAEKEKEKEKRAVVSAFHPFKSPKFSIF